VGAVESERLDGVLLIRLNRPEARNAVNAELAHGVADAVRTLDADPALRVGVLTGAGDSFCSGMDLKAFAGLRVTDFTRGKAPHVPRRGFAGLVRRPPRKPMIAAVEGAALAGGFEVALACDLIVAAENAEFGIPEARRGAIAAGGALVRLPKRAPYHVVMELALTGAPIGAVRAYELGIVNRLAGPGAALDAALELARVVASNAPVSVDASKRLVKGSIDLSEARAWLLQLRLARRVFMSRDAREGAKAFAEKREPVWRGR
jgi:enoyl-CoA hydratase